MARFQPLNTGALYPTTNPTKSNPDFVLYSQYDLICFSRPKRGKGVSRILRPHHFYTMFLTNKPSV